MKQFPKLKKKFKKPILSIQQKKDDLLKLITDLKKEVVELSKTHFEDASTIVSFTDITANEVTKEKKNPKLLKISIEGLKTSVEKFETTHPALVNSVNLVCNFLSNLGI